MRQPLAERKFQYNHLQSIWIISMCNNYLENHVYHRDRKQSAKKDFPKQYFDSYQLFLLPILISISFMFLFSWSGSSCCNFKSLLSIDNFPHSRSDGGRDMEGRRKALISKYFLSCFRQQSPRWSGGERKERQMMIGSENSLTVNQTIWGK